MHELTETSPMGIVFSVVAASIIIGMVIAEIRCLAGARPLACGHLRARGRAHPRLCAHGPCGARMPVAADSRNACKHACMCTYA
jgi:hypothetical protein